MYSMVNLDCHTLIKLSTLLHFYGMFNIMQLLYATAEHLSGSDKSQLIKSNFIYLVIVSYLVICCG